MSDRIDPLIRTETSPARINRRAAPSPPRGGATAGDVASGMSMDIAARDAMTDPIPAGSRWRPYYRTELGRAFAGDALAFLRDLPDSSLKLVVTSPPYPLSNPLEYGNVPISEYIAWFMPFATEIQRVLRADGSFVLELGGVWNQGRPTRAVYQFELLIALVNEGFHLAQEFYWFNPTRLPRSVRWITKGRVRVKDSVNTLWWLSKTPHPDADNRRVLVPYSAITRKRLADPHARWPYSRGWHSSQKPMRSFGGSIPHNLLRCATATNDRAYSQACRVHGHRVHPARFPRVVPEFFIKFLTVPGELVYDPFAGSNVTGSVAEELGRRWLATELRTDYLDASKLRFQIGMDLAAPLAQGVD